MVNKYYHNQFVIVGQIAQRRAINNSNNGDSNPDLVTFLKKYLHVNIDCSCSLFDNVLISNMRIVDRG